jgi:tetratricopeptide (TPR) repeat protein
MYLRPITLAVAHVEGSSPASFTLIRSSDGKSMPPVVIPSPYEFPVDGRPNSNLMVELRWYLEDFLHYPFDPEIDHADRVLDALSTWGKLSFNSLFDRRDAGAWLTDSESIQIRSDDPRLLSWPWEALFDPQAGAFIAQQRRVERRINRILDPPAVGPYPKERVNILLVVARPYENDIGYRSIARPLIELIQSHNLPAHVDVLRPPTFDNLRDHLRAKPGFYHILHFDGHGSFGDPAGEYSPNHFRANQGCLVFENEKGEPDPKSAPDLCTLLREYTVPAVVLNACESGTLDGQGQDLFATVATALLQSGMRSVVAMAYSLYVSAAQVFLPSFYRRLFESGSLAEGVRAGRQQMLSNPNRTSVRGPYPLRDWLLPVLYQQDPFNFEFAKEAKLEIRKSCLPQLVKDHREEYGFIGRDEAILQMERAIHRKAPCILIHALGGIGKTTLARGFLRWLDETGGLDAALWFDFREIRSAEYVLNRTGETFYGENFAVSPDKLELLNQAFQKRRIVLVWDNFESTVENLTVQDRADLARFLDTIRGARGKVIMTSRSAEDWLGVTRRFQLRLRGLDGEERWEYCQTIIHDLGLKINQQDPALNSLMDQLAGHPLAMRVILPKLQTASAASIANALQNNIAELRLDEDEEQRHLFGTLRFVEQALSDDLKPLMALVALCERYLSVGLLVEIARHVEVSWTRPRIDQLLTALEAAGLVKNISSGHYEMHPLLTSYLRSNISVSEILKRTFAGAMGAAVADKFELRPHHEQRNFFFFHSANLYYALNLSERFGMHMYSTALLQFLAIYARKSHNLIEASRLFNKLVEHATVQKDAAVQASTYHELGIVAHVERNFEAANEWYRKSLDISEGKEELRKLTASTYHQLGLIAYHLHDLPEAHRWCCKSLAIEQEQGNRKEIGTSYHHLALIAGEQRDFEKASEWHHKSLDIKKALGNYEGVCNSYHGLGCVALEQNDFETAIRWYREAIAISEKYGLRAAAANTYQQLGLVAERQGDCEVARDWYLKALAIDEEQGNQHGVAGACGSLGRLAGRQGYLVDGGRWLARSIAAFIRARDQYLAQGTVDNFMFLYRNASAADKQKLVSIWNDANLGPFPRESI